MKQNLQCGHLQSVLLFPIPFDTAVTVFAGQLFLRLISSKLFSAHRHTSTSTERYIDRTRH